jgi:hypothetical protein
VEQASANATLANARHEALLPKKIEDVCVAPQLEPPVLADFPERAHFNETY